MIEELQVENFSVLGDAGFSFAHGINVVIGTNGSGKSHLLKLAYAVSRWSQEMARRSKTARPDKATLQKELAEKCLRVFGCENIGRLATRGQGVRRSEVDVRFFDEPTATCEFSFSTRTQREVALDKVPEQFFSGEVVFFPTKEVISMFPGFAALYRNYALQIDETYYDLCLALEKPLSRGPRLAEIKPMLDQVEQILGGRVYLDNGRFYLQQPGGGIFEMPLVAEGYRKLAAVAYLLANGTLTQQSILFWDEPETNLNPAYMVKLAEILVALAQHGAQVILATHSLFMMRELSLQLGQVENRKVQRCYFALQLPDGARGVRVTTGRSAEEVEPITALDAEIQQSERYLADGVNAR